MEQVNLIKKEVSITRIKSMADGTYRIEIDFREIDGKTLGELENLRKEGIVSLILTSSNALKQVLDERDN